MKNMNLKKAMKLSDSKMPSKYKVKDYYDQNWKDNAIIIPFGAAKKLNEQGLVNSNYWQREYYTNEGNIVESTCVDDKSLLAIPAPSYQYAKNFCDKNCIDFFGLFTEEEKIEAQKDGISYFKNNVSDSKRKVKDSQTFKSYVVYDENEHFLNEFDTPKQAIAYAKSVVGQKQIVDVIEFEKTEDGDVLDANTIWWSGTKAGKKARYDFEKGKEDWFKQREFSDSKRRVKDGFSNNPNYVGDWFGKGQIDFSAIINPEDDGDVYMIKLWCGSGYVLDVYLCKAHDIYEAMDIVFEWSYKNEGENDIVFDYDYLMSECQENFEKYPDYFGNDLSDDYEEFEMRWFDDYISSENGYYARSENFFVDKVPSEYLENN